MRKFIWVVSIFSAVSFISNAYAQFGKSAGLRFYSDFKPVVGGWSEYQITPKGEAPSKMKIAIVGKEGDDYWYETVMEGKQEGRIISKMLVSGNPGDNKNVKRVIFKTGNEPAMEMPVQMMHMQQGSQPQEPKGKMIDKGEETIKVPAGTIKTQHYQYQDGGTAVDAWVKKDISPYGTVKSQSKDLEMVLTGYGSGAKTLITETPKKFEMPKMPRGMQKGSKPGKDEED
ncbi:MAG TPA: hypothetical protein VLK23_01935 [Thermodesulfobacteriota bacterium]|nr:hypothetical protein [Thermodesulfobacteriota bacterium]